MSAQITGFILLLIYTTSVYSQTDRTYTDVNLQLIEEINLSEIDVFTPTGLSMDDSGNIVFFDFDRQFIAHTTLEDISSIELYGGKQGRGPGEFQNVWTTDIDEGMIYVSEINNPKISKWSLEGNLLEEYAIKTKYVIPTRFTLCENNDLMYILSRQYWRRGILHQFDKRGGHIKSFQKIDSRDERHVFYTGGYLECDGSGNLFYAPMYVNKIRKYNPQGELIVEKEVFGGFENENIIERNGRWIDLHKEAKTISGDIHIHIQDNELYVAYSGIRARRFQTIDIYAADNIVYKHSISMPRMFANFTLSDQHIITIERESRDADSWLRVYTYEGMGR
jgi:hypothetical protein